jgi:uroporphyrinogen-III decarboxylase
MTGRERILAALHRQKVDRIPWSPLVDSYLLSSLPLATSSRLGRPGGPRDKYELCRQIGADIFDWHPQGRTLHYRNVQIHTRKSGNDVFTTIRTPAGTLTERRMVTPVTTFLAEPKIKTVADLAAYRFWIENTQVEPDDSVRRSQQLCGDDGLAIVCGPQSPAQLLIGEESGLENFYFLLADHEPELTELLDAMHAKNLETYRMLAQEPTVAILAPEDVSTTTMSPEVCGRFTFRYLDEYADVAHAAGKLLLGHMCGRLAGMASLIAASRIDGVESVTPPDIGDMPIDRARAAWPGKILIGGLEPAKLATLNPAAVHTYVRDTLRAASPGDGFILSTGDATPYGTPLENLRAVSQEIEAFHS